MVMEGALMCYLKGHSTYITHEVQFTHQQEDNWACGNSCMLSSVDVKGDFWEGFVLDWGWDF